MGSVPALIGFREKYVAVGPGSYWQAARTPCPAGSLGVDCILTGGCPECGMHVSSPERWSIKHAGKYSKAQAGQEPYEAVSRAIECPYH